MTTRAPRVSVIVPTFNRAQMICHSVDSVLGQSYTDLEVLIVDDGSTDNTRDVVASRYGDDPRVRYLYKQNGGAASAQNHGFRQARGELIGLNGDDDLWFPEKLAVQVPLLDARRDAVFCFSDCVFMGGGADGRSFFESSDFDGRVSLAELTRRTFIPAGSVLIRREHLDGEGPFDEAFAVCEDWDLWIRLMAKGPAVCVDRPLYAYRQHSGSQLCDDFAAMLRDKIGVLEKNRDLILRSVDGGWSSRRRLSVRIRHDLDKWKADLNGAEFKQMLADGCQDRTALLRRLRVAIRIEPYRAKHYRRFATMLIFGPRLMAVWYGRDRKQGVAAGDETPAISELSPVTVSSAVEAEGRGPKPSRAYTGRPGLPKSPCSS